MTGEFKAGVYLVSRRVPEKLSKREGVKALIEKKLNLPTAIHFEIHLVKPEKAEPYMRREGNAPC